MTPHSPSGPRGYETDVWKIYDLLQYIKVERGERIADLASQRALSEVRAHLDPIRWPGAPGGVHERDDEE